MVWPTVSEIDDVSQTLLRCARWLSEHQDRSKLREVFLEHIDLMLTVHHAIPSADIAKYADLQRITIYNDWHRHNMLTIGGRISGLIDFDAIIEAPRIVDVQNALTYILVSKNQPDRRLISAFCEAYREMAPLSQLEVSLIYPVMLDRIAWWTGDLIGQARREGAGPPETLLIRLIRLFSWLSQRHDRLTSDLMPGLPAAHR